MGKVFDANDILRVGGGAISGIGWNAVITDDDVASVEPGDFVAVGDLAGTITLTLNPNVTGGEAVAVWIGGDPDGNNANVEAVGGQTINGAGSVTLDTQYQTLYLVYGGANDWAILESGEGVAEVFSVFGNTGNVLPVWSIENVNNLVGQSGAGLDVLTLKYASSDIAVSVGDDSGGVRIGSPDTNTTLTIGDSSVAVVGVMTVDGPLTADAATDAANAPRLSQLTSALTITAGALPNMGAWVSGTAKVNPVARQITVNVEVVCDGTANAATCAVAISPDDNTYTTIATPGLSAALNTVGGATLLCPVNLPAGWHIKLTLSHTTVAASVYY